jgi:hypothetical protein
MAGSSDTRRRQSKWKLGWSNALRQKSSLWFKYMITGSFSLVVVGMYMLNLRSCGTEYMTSYYCTLGTFGNRSSGWRMVGSEQSVRE